MIIFGWIIATCGACGIISSVILEIMLGEPVFMLLSKISMGIMAVGGIILWLRRNK